MGGLGRLTDGVWQEPEPDKFAAIALQMGVPKKAIVIENKSTNTGENVPINRQLLQQKKSILNLLLLYKKPYMEELLQYLRNPTRELTIEKVIQIMAGDLQRIKVYREQVFKFHSKFPQEAWDAYEQLGSCRLYTTINKRVKQKSSFTG